MKTSISSLYPIITFSSLINKTDITLLYVKMLQSINIHYKCKYFSAKFYILWTKKIKNDKILYYSTHIFKYKKQLYINITKLTS